MDTAHFPLTVGELRRWRLGLPRHLGPGPTGAHLRRLQGQGLEFHEYRTFTPGDDARHIDWRASARSGGPRDLIVRTYRHETRLRLLVSLDNRPSMNYPSGCEKQLIARWIIAAMAAVVQADDDHCLAHPLFGPPVAPVPLRTRDPVATLHRLDRLLPSAGDTPPNERGLLAALKPTTVWVILTDLYFDDPAHRLKRLLARAAETLCWVLLIDLDAWPAESARLDGRRTRIQGPLVLPDAEPRINFDTAARRQVEQRINAHKTELVGARVRGALSRSCWRWPPDRPDQPDPTTLFLQHWRSDRMLARLFRRSM